MANITVFTRMALNTCLLFEDPDCSDLLAGKALPKSPGAEHAVGHWVMKHRFANTAAILTGWIVGLPLVCLLSYYAYHDPSPGKFILHKAVYASCLVAAVVLVAAWCAYQVGQMAQELYDPESEFVKRAAARVEAMSILLRRAWAYVTTFGLIGGLVFVPLMFVYVLRAIDAKSRE